MIGPPFDGGEALYAIQHIESHPARGAWIEMLNAAVVRGGGGYEC